MSGDKNGAMLGFELRRVSGNMARLRLIYPTGDVNHMIPDALYRDIARGVDKLAALFHGKSNSAKFGSWAGPE